MTLALAAWCLVAQQADQDVFTCDTTEGWTVFDTAEGNEDPELRIENGALEFRFDRKSGGVSLLLVPAVLTNLRSIEFDVWSREKTAIAIGFDDLDRAKFHHGIELQAGKWKKVRIQHSEFTLNDDSPVKKPRLDPKRLGFGFGLLDASPFFGAEGPNVLRIDNMKILREPLPAARIPSTIEGRTVEISADGIAHGDISVRNGKLRITANRFVFSGNLYIENGELEFSKCVVSLNGRFAHDLGIVGVNGSMIRFRESIVVNNFVHGIGLKEKSRLEMEKVQAAANGFTVDVQEGCSVLLDQVHRPGEVVLSDGAKLTIDACDFVLVWLNPVPGVKHALRLPKGAEIEQFLLPREVGQVVQIHHSRNILWGLLSRPKTDVTIEEGEFVAAGVLFDGGDHTITDLQKPAFSDRKLVTEKARIAAWNFYAAGSTNLTITGCTVGEVIAFDDSRVTFRNAVCDGGGGYFRAEGRSVVVAQKSTFTCAVVATAEARLTLENCRVDGPVSASGSAVVRMPGTTAANVEKLEKAVIEKK
jgi:hypothetical protein